MSPTLQKIAYEENGTVLRLSVDTGDRYPTTYRALLYHAPALETLSEDTLLDKETLATLEEANAHYAATVRALRLLAAGDQSVAHLARKLRERGVERALSARVAADMKEQGYIREGRQAYRLAILRANTKLWGRRRITADLVNRGYPVATVRAAILKAEEEGEIDFAALAHRLCEEKLGENPDRDEKKKLLWKHGF